MEQGLVSTYEGLKHAPDALADVYELAVWSLIETTTEKPVDEAQEARLVSTYEGETTR